MDVTISALIRNSSADGKTCLDKDGHDDRKVTRDSDSMPRLMFSTSSFFSVVPHVP